MSDEKLNYSLQYPLAGELIWRNESVPMKAILLFTLAAAGMLLSSCNTMIGFGRDMRMGGEGLENVASKASGGGGGDDDSGAPVY